MRTHYLKNDLRRTFLSVRFLVAAVGTGLALVMIAKTQSFMPTNVISVYDLVKMRRATLLTLLFGAIPYGMCFQEDLSDKFIQVCLIRGDVKRYGWSKITAVFLSAWSAMFLGMLLFFLIASLQYPLTMDDTYLVENQITNPVLFLAVSAVKESMLAAVMAGCTAWGSLYLKDKMFVFTFPIIFYYFLVNYVDIWMRLPEQLALFRIFGGFYSVWNNSWIDLGYAAGVMLLFWMMTGCGIQYRIGKEIRRK